MPESATSRRYAREGPRPSLPSRYGDRVAADRLPPGELPIAADDRSEFV